MTRSFDEIVSILKETLFPRFITSLIGFSRTSFHQHFIFIQCPLVQTEEN